MVVANNIMALNSHRNLKAVGTKQEVASARLSSGYRINSAADDAAGLAISEKMRAQIRGLNMASKNAQDAISLIQTAEGGMQEIDNMIQRIRELVVYASNDTQENNFTGTGDRQKIQDEINQLTAEIDSMSERVEFNKKKVINGDYANPAELLASASAKLTAAIAKLTNATATLTAAQTQQTNASTDLSGVQTLMSGYDAAVATQEAALQTAITNLPTDLSSAVTTYSGGSDTKNLSGVLTKFQTALQNLANTNPSGLNESSIRGLVTQYFSGASGTNGDGDTIGDGNVTATITGGGMSALSITIADAGGDTVAALNTAVNAMAAEAAKVVNAVANVNAIKLAGAAVNTLGETGVAGHFNTPLTPGAPSATGNADYSAGIGSYATLVQAYTEYSDTKSTADSALAKAQNEYDVVNNSIKSYQAQVDAAVALQAKLGSSSPGLYFQVGANAEQGLQMSIGAVKTDVLGIGNGNGESSIDVVKHTGADITNFLDTMDEALSYVTSERSKLGAAQNRLEYTIRSLDISAENLTSAESRVRDTDMAKEMMNLTQANILQQAAVAMLAQANQAPQSILQLLQ
jgi:flagellin